MNKLIIAACVAALAACSAAPRVAPAPDLVPLDVTGEYRHEPSHMIFPGAYGAFHRVSLYQRGADNTRITAGYVGGPPRCLTAVTLFLDRAAAGEDIDAAFARARAETLRAHPSAVLEAKDAEVDSPWRRATFIDGDRRVELGMRRMRGWDITDRSVYPLQCSGEVRESLRQFLPWER